MTDRPIKEKRPNPSAKEARDKRLADVLKRRKDATRGGTGGKDNTNSDQSSEDS
jgi:hypothetical protein